MRILVWQWSRFGSAPRFAALLAEGLAAVPGATVTLSLAAGAEILRSRKPPRCDLPVVTYNGWLGFLFRVATAPAMILRLARRISASRPDVAVCAMAGPLDLMMAATLRLLGIPFIVLVHDADAHPGDGFPMQMWIQRRLCHRAATVATLSDHVGESVLRQGLAGTTDRPLIRLNHPPLPYEIRREPPGVDSHFRLLSFGRLLPYKGLDLLAEGLRRLGPDPAITVRVVGSGPESPALAMLRTLPSVIVENRWVPEDEVGTLLGWADAIVLPYREASQSGVAAAALAAGRYVIATKVGGLTEQLLNEPLAVLCEPQPDSLADALQRVLRDHDAPASPMVNSRGAWEDLGRTLVDNLGALLRRRTGLGTGNPLASQVAADRTERGPKHYRS